MRDKGVVAIVVAVFALGASVRATAILLFRSPERIVLAADSAKASTTVDGSESTDGRLCKIRQGGRWWLLHGGVRGGERLNFHDAFERAVAPTTTLQAAVAALRETWRRDLAGPAATMRPEQIPDGSVLLLVAVAGVEDGVPVAGLFWVGITRSPALTFTDQAVTCPGNGCPDGRYLSLGAAKRGGLKTPSPPWARPAETARQLIEAEIRATPQHVRGPVDVLEITAAGARWIDQDPRSACR